MSHKNISSDSKLFYFMYPNGYNPYKIKWFDIVIAILLFLISFTVYTKTLTPSVGAGDSGELTTAVYNMGACHPPGYPLYAIVGKLFTFLPINNIAWRLNLFSAFSAAVSVFFLYLIIIKLLGLNRDNNNGADFRLHIPAIAASLAFAFSDTNWSQASGGEVYSLNILLVGLMSFVLVLWYEEMIYFRNTEKLHFAERKTLLLAYTMGLSLTNHMLPMWNIVTYGIIMLPLTIAIIISDRSDKDIEELKERSFALTLLVGILFIALLLFMTNAYNLNLIFPQHVPYIMIAIFILPAYLTLYTIGVKIFKPKENWVDRFFEYLNYGYILFVIAMSLYLFLMVRAKALAPLPDPKPLSWGDTQTFDILFNHMMRKQYGRGGGGDLNYLSGQLFAIVKFIINNYNIVNFIIGLVGALYLFYKEKVWALYTFFSMLILDVMLMKFVNPELDPRTLSFQVVMYIQQFYYFAIYIAFGYQIFFDIKDILKTIINSFKKRVVNA